MPTARKRAPRPSLRDNSPRAGFGERVREIVLETLSHPLDLPSEFRGWIPRWVELAGYRTPTSHGDSLHDATVASLDGGGHVPQAELGSGSGGAGTKVLFDDQTFKTPAAAAPAMTTVEKNICAAPFARRGGSFQITGLSGLTADKPVSIMQASGPYTGKGTRTDEAEMDAIDVAAKVLDATTIQCYWRSSRRVRGNYKFDYWIGA